MRDLGATIVAVATPPGRGGIGCVRLSGPDAPAIAAGLFRPASDDIPDRPGTTRFGRFIGRDGAEMDHGYVVRFAPEASFTAEPVVELWAHGSPPVLGELVSAAIDGGAEPADPGEFTYRAVRNGRIDLAAAEAIRDLVHARTTYQARVAFQQAEGALSRRLTPSKDRLTDLIARGEAAVEFVDESETHLPAGVLANGIAAVRQACADLASSFRAGRLVRDGARLAIVGLPNAGKSSLFNRLLVRERAIVTDVPGTTRDTLEETIDLGGIPLTLIDTAGLRTAFDPVENEGVRRARQARAEADLVLVVIDGSRAVDPAEVAACDPGDSDGPGVVVVVNKCDLPEAAGRTLPHPEAVQVSARTGAGCDELRARLADRLVGDGATLEDPVVTEARHAAALERCAAAMDRAAEAVTHGWTEEVVLEELRDGMRHLGAITGEFGTDDLYDRIFTTFCIGK